MTPKISILTATLNALPGLRGTVASLASQTFRDFEHVVVDADRPMEHRLACRSRPTSEMDKRADRGIADALNMGLAIANGEWILVLHAEDTLFSRDVLAEASNALDTQVDIVSYDVLFVRAGHPRTLASGGLSLRINFKTTLPHQGAFCRRVLFDRIGPFDTSFQIGMDYEFFLRAYRNEVRADVVRKHLSKMPATGVSSRLDWNSLRRRFSEERANSEKHATVAGLEGHIRVLLAAIHRVSLVSSLCDGNKILKLPPTLTRMSGKDQAGNRVLVLCKRHYTNRDLITDRYGRLFHLPYELGRLGNEVLVLAADYQSRSAPRTRADSVRFESIPLSVHRVVPFYRRVREAVRDFSPDVIVASSDTQFVWLGKRLARLEGTPFAFDILRQLFVVRFCQDSRIQDTLSVRLSIRRSHAGWFEPPSRAGHRRAERSSLSRMVLTQRCFVRWIASSQRELLGIPPSEIVIGYIGALHKGRALRISLVL